MHPIQHTDCACPPWGLYLVTHDDMVADGSVLGLAETLLAGGLRALQLRAKAVDVEQIRRMGHELRAMTRRAGAAFFVNDRLDLALELDADGVHVGQEDAPVAEVRRALGPKRLVGLSTHNEEQIRAAAALPIDCIGVGPVFATSTKVKADPVAGPDLLRWAVAHSQHPVIAIGGIDATNLDAVLDTGVRNIAVVSAIARAPDPTRAGLDLIARIRRAMEEDRHAF